MAFVANQPAPSSFHEDDPVLGSALGAAPKFEASSKAPRTKRFRAAGPEQAQKAVAQRVVSDVDTFLGQYSDNYEELGSAEARDLKEEVRELVFEGAAAVADPRLLAFELFHPQVTEGGLTEEQLEEQEALQLREQEAEMQSSQNDLDAAKAELQGSQSQLHEALGTAYHELMAELMADWQAEDDERARKALAAEASLQAAHQLSLLNAHAKYATATLDVRGHFADQEKDSEAKQRGALEVRLTREREARGVRAEKKLAEAAKRKATETTRLTARLRKALATAKTKDQRRALVATRARKAASQKLLRVNGTKH